MKLRTSELTDIALDWAVNQIEECCDDPVPPPFSTSWAWGGPIIEQEGIELTINTRVPEGTWLATRVEGSAICEVTGPTQLIAAMRCYVKSQLGDEVDVPSELTDTNVELFGETK